MKKAILGIFLLTLSFTATQADDLQDLQGKWVVSKKNEEGQPIKQTLEIVKNKFTFKLIGENNEVRLVAVADLELKKVGAFKAFHLANLRAGDSAGDLSDVDDDYNVIYIITNDGLALASNFDKEHENRKPAVDIYQKSK